MHRGPLAIMSTALAAGILATAPFAVAKNGSDDPAGDDRGGDRGGASSVVRSAGTCSLASTSKLKIKRDDGRIEVEFEVDENRNGATWGVLVKRNGARVISRSAVTRAPSGSFSVEKKIAPGSSARTVVTAVARRAATGEVCRATATL